MSESQEILSVASPADVETNSKSEDIPVAPPVTTQETEAHARELSAALDLRGFPLPPQYTASLESMDLLGISTEYRQGKGEISEGSAGLSLLSRKSG